MKEYKARIVDNMLKEKLEAKALLLLKDLNGAEKQQLQCKLRAAY